MYGVTRSVGYSLTEPNPTALPDSITLQGAKDYARVTWDAEDQQAERLLQSAVAMLESDIRGYLRPAVVSEWYSSGAGAWPGDTVIPLHRYPLVDVTAVNYLDTDDVWQLWDPANYEADTVSIPPRVRFLNSLPALQPSLQALEIQYDCHYETVPAVAVQAVYECFATLLDNRAFNTQEARVWQAAVRHMAWEPPP